MANRYWVGNAGTWTDTAHWSATSGGAGGQSAPVAGDVAIFDANSITSASQTITCAVSGVAATSASMATLDLRNVLNTPTFSVGLPNGPSAAYGWTLNLTTSLLMSNPVTFSDSSSRGIGFIINSTGASFDTNDRSLGAQIKVASGTTTVTNTPLRTTNVTVSGGTFTTNNLDVTLTGAAVAGAAFFSMSSGTTNFGTSEIRLNSAAARTFSVTGGTLNASTATVFTQALTIPTGTNIGRVVFLSSVAGSISASCTIGTLSVRNVSLTITAGATVTVSNTLDINGKPASLAVIKSKTAASVATLALPARQVATYASFQDITVTGNTLTARASTNVSGNTNINFVAGIPSALAMFT